MTATSTTYEPVELVIGKPGEKFIAKAGYRRIEVYKLSNMIDGTASYQPIGFFGSAEEAQAYIDNEGSK